MLNVSQDYVNKTLLLPMDHHSPWLVNTLKYITRLQYVRKTVGLAQSHVQLLPVGLRIGASLPEFRTRFFTAHIISHSSIGL